MYFLQGTIWFIERDITKCFENIDHNLFLDLLAKKTKDSRFLNLMLIYIETLTHQLNTCAIRLM